MFRHILLPTDGSERSAKAIRMGVALAKSGGTRVTGIHVLADFHLMIAYEGSFDPATEAKIEQESRAKANEYLAALQKIADDAGVPCETVCVTDDHPHESIIATAKERGCDLIVMSSHGRRGIVSLLLGSKTAKVLTHSDIPVLVVR